MSTDSDTARTVTPDAQDEPLQDVIRRQELAAMRLVETRLGTHIEFDLEVPAEFAADVVRETYGSDPECYWIGETCWSMGVFA